MMLDGFMDALLNFSILWTDMYIYCIRLEKKYNTLNSDQLDWILSC